jgi:2,5-dioxopentanoate dehydrogenase
MNISGKNLIGHTYSSEGTVGIQAPHAQTLEPLGPLFYKATQSEANQAVAKAKAAFQHFRTCTAEDKALFLEAIATEIEALGDDLIERYMAESGLPQPRAIGERGRTMGQLRLFAGLIREGSWLRATIDTALPDRQPLPRPDLRSMERPLGPVLVFGASNFPLAFSVAGGDTAAALAAGCPVIFKAHASHLGTSDLVGQAIKAAAEKTHMPDGVFSMLYDDGIEIGSLLAKHPDIEAIAFTGSFRGGKALFDVAAQRAKPIPVYAEMGSTNPVFVLPKYAVENAETLAQQYVGSVTMGVGQFCTNPGLLIYQNNELFKNHVKQKADASPAGVMLNAGIKTAYEKGISHLKNSAGVLATGQSPELNTAAQTTVLHTDAQTFLEKTELSEEVFGPSSVMVQASSKAEMIAIAQGLEGHLTATVIGSTEEIIEYAELVNILEQKVGRLLFNGFPTGVEVCHAMVHGGPFPATTDARSTSVGSAAITRFTRPVCFQDMPDALLPAELKKVNVLGIWRKVNGEMKKD